MVASAGAAGLALVMLAVFAWPGAGRAPGGATTMMSRRQVRPPATASSPGTPAPVWRPVREPRDALADQAALDYLRASDRPVAAHVRKVIWTAPILRVYTDLPGTAANSRTARRLCAVAAAYLNGIGRSPIVFVHARERDGYPVLANKMDENDDCRLNAVP